MKRRKGYFSISAVARMFSVHQQTIRLYEKEGLISPKRSTGNTRMFSEEDVNRLEEVMYLTHKMGVNLAGVDIILRLQKKITKLQNDMNKLFNQTQGQLEQESAIYKQSLKKQVEILHAIKQKSAISLEETNPKKKTFPHEPKGAQEGIPFSPKELGEEDDWKIEYEE